MKRALKLITLVLSMILISSLSFASTIDVKIEDKQVDFNSIHNGKPIGSPYIENNRTYIPIRIISEKLGYKVTWIQEKQTAIIEKANKKLEITIGETTALVHGVRTPIDTKSENTKAVIRSGRTYLPVRFVSETMGDKVEYRQPSTSDVKVMTVYINSINLPVEYDKDPVLIPYLPEGAELLEKVWLLSDSIVWIYSYEKDFEDGGEVNQVLVLECLDSGAISVEVMGFDNYGKSFLAIYSPQNDTLSYNFYKAIFSFNDEMTVKKVARKFVKLRP